MKTSTEAQAEHQRFRETRPVLSLEGARRGRRESPISGRARVHTRSMNASISGGWSMVTSEENGKQANMEDEGIASLETEDANVLP